MQVKLRISNQQTLTRRNHVQVTGAGPETIVWAHGFGTDQKAWHGLLPQFTGTHTNLLFDHVGSGHSDWSAYSAKRYRSLHAFANDLIEILDAFEVKNCLYVGHSVSGMVGLLASLLAPEFFRRIVTISASPRYLIEEGYPGVFTEENLNQMFAAANENYSAWVSGFAPQIAQNGDRPEVAELFHENLMHLRPDIALSMLRMILESDHRKDLPAVQVKCFFLQPVRDPAVPVAVGRYLHENVKGSGYRELAAEGHLPHLSSPEEVSIAIHHAVASLGAEEE